MPIWTGPRDVVVDLVNRFCAVVPPEIANPSRTDNQDDIYALGEQMACAEGMSMWLSREMEPAYADNTFLSTLARGVGLSRQSGEGDPALLARIRTPPLTVTLDLIQQALQQIVNGSGLSTDPVLMIELPRSALYYSPPLFDLPPHQPERKRGVLQHRIQVLLGQAADGDRAHSRRGSIHLRDRARRAPGQGDRRQARRRRNVHGRLTR